MFTFLKKNLLVLLGIITGVGTVFISAFHYVAGKNATPTNEEAVAMEILPGYMFVYEGSTNLINHSGSVNQFRKQHRLMPYLVLVAERIKIYNWQKEWPIRIKETENEVVITLPCAGELRGDKVFWGASYLLEVVIDKKTMSIVSALRGS